MNTHLEASVAALVEARRSGVLLPSWSEQTGAATLEEAYWVQEAVAARSGEVRGGWKLGCTSEAAQRNLGSEGPIAGPIASARVFESGVTLCDVRMDMLLVEAEFAFRLAADVPARAEPYRRIEIMAALGALYPAIELVQSRFMESRMPILGIISDHAGAGSLILGAPVMHWRAHDLPNQAASLANSGVELARGFGHAVLGDPINAMVWLANFLSARGLGLRAGEVVTTGTLTPPQLVAPGAHVVADFGDLGRCEARFKPPAA